MNGTILLNYNEDVTQVEEDEKSRFLKDLLTQMGVPVSDFWDTEGPLSVAQRIKLRTILSTYGIQVIDSLDGLLQVYVDNELTAEWNKCTYKLKRDLRERDPKKQLYLEMLIDYWTVFEEQE